MIQYLNDIQFCAMTGALEPTPDNQSISPGTLRRAQRLERRRQEILAVAETLFAANGYDGTSIERIATGSGYSVGGLYNFFPGKQALYAAVLESHAHTLGERLIACAEADRDGMTTLLDMAATAVDTIAAMPDHAGSAIGTIPPGADHDVARKNLRTILEAYARAISRGQADGTVRDGNPRHLAQYVGGLILGHSRIDTKRGGGDDQQAHETFLAVLHNAFAPKSP